MIVVFKKFDIWIGTLLDRNGRTLAFGFSEEGLANPGSSGRR